MSAIPQYAKSVDPTVVAAVQANRDSRDRFHQEALAFSAEHGTDPLHAYVPSEFLGIRRVDGIGGDKPSSGQWVSAAKGRAWRPGKRNPIYKQMEAIKHRDEEVPGIAAGYDGASTGTGRKILIPQTFVQAGAAWFHLTSSPAAEQTGTWGSGEFDHALWTEVLGSEWHAALEALRATS